MSAISFTEANSAELVVERLSKGGESQLATFLAAFVRHLHSAVRESKPSGADWRSAIQFLTDVGHASDEKRQEWALLSDLLGVTALVEEINAHRPAGATPNTVRGPFYRPDAPHLSVGSNISLDGIGEPLRVSCRIVDLDGIAIAGAIVETWQANAQGLYENQQPDLQPEFNLRGVFTTGADGVVHYQTVKPAGYAVPADGPVGLLLGQIGLPLRRPAHLHFIVKAEGFETISTHIYEAGDPHLGEDALFGVKQALIANFCPPPAGAELPLWSLDFTFVMVRSRSKGRAAP